MSDQATTQQSWDGLLGRVVDQITPLFQTSDVNWATARKHAIGAIDAYAPRCPADIVSIARVIAFSMATLAALGIAAEQDLPAAQKMRYFGKANALNRSADQTERLMLQRRRDQAADPPPVAEPAPDDVAEFPNADALIDEAMAEYRAARDARLTEPAQAARPAEPQARPNPATTAKPAVHASAAQPSPAARHTQHLPRQLAMTQASPPMG